MPESVVVLGGGHGVASVLSALRDRALDLTVIVTIADDGGSSGALRRRDGGPAVGDIRRSLIALAGEDRQFAQAFARPVTINRLGEHPLGNLVIRSLANAFGDLETASDWLGEQFDISGRVLPASAEPVSLLADTRDGVIRGESAIRVARKRIRRLRFDPERPKTPAAVLEAIAEAAWVLLAPGSLFTSVLAATAIPDVASALTRTGARVLWICNLVPEARESTGMTAADHLRAIRNHGVRFDAVLCDPSASLRFAPDQLEQQRLPAIWRPLRAEQRGVHDPSLLRAALLELFANPTSADPTPSLCGVVPMRD
jgi:uncharacterized cofD-like protein